MSSVYKAYGLIQQPSGLTIVYYNFDSNNRMVNWPGAGPMVEWMNNANQNTVDNLFLQIMNTLPAPIVTGTKIYCGYGTSSDEMISSNRYRLYASL
ncbi:hypothetical protein CCP4SC76_810014 [Gammaproteobacteria bacterium]